MYYGQFNPPVDWLIERFFASGFIGSCVEVGAVDGRYLSNTLHFEESGWQCLCIEPNSYYHEALRRNRKMSMPYAMSDKNEDEVVLYRVQLTNNSFDAATSLVPDEKLLQQLGHMIKGRDEIKVDMRTLDTCLEKTGWLKTDFVAIDTEGTELTVLKGFDLERWRPRLLVIENNHDTPETTDYLRPRGYHKAIRHEVNDFYIRVI